MFFTGRVTFPFSIRNSPSRVRPVNEDRLRIQRADVPEARHEHAAIDARDQIVHRGVATLHDRVAGPAVGSLPIFCAQKRE